MRRRPKVKRKTHAGRAYKLPRIKTSRVRESLNGHAAPMVREIGVLTQTPLPNNLPDYLYWQGDAEHFVDALPATPIFDLVVTSPPYNLGKEYEKDKHYATKSMDRYVAWQERLIKKIVPLVKDTGSICWQVGNYVENGSIVPLDILLDPIFRSLKLALRNRIIWRFGHGLNCKKRFSGRYEVILWYTKSESYVFNLDAVRIPQKYPGKKYFKGPKAGEYSSNPLGKNPEDVWDIPNVKSNHIEKTSHPCQFPAGLVERLILSMTKPGDLVFDPFAGVGSTGVAAAVHGRRFIGSELVEKYVDLGRNRINAALRGTPKYRPHNIPIYDHRKSNLSKIPMRAGS